MAYQTHRPRKAAFTLVEMLVVISIIAILAALLLPAVMAAITRARNAAIALELKQIENAIEAYRLEKGDYPPNFRNVDDVRRHIAKCYPRIDPTYFLAFMKYAFPLDGSGNPTNPTTATAVKIDEAESVVFWLSMTDKNPQYPFLSVQAGINAFLPTAITLPADPKVFYDFDQTRLVKTLAVDVPSFNAKYCKDTFYMYIDGRSYNSAKTDFSDVCRFASFDGNTPGDTYAFADDNATGVRPYWSITKATNPSGASGLPVRDNFKPMNATTFQIICAGQDGDFGCVVPSSAGDQDAKQFPTGLHYNQADKDNITNFSNGRTLGDSIP